MLIRRNYFCLGATFDTSSSALCYLWNNGNSIFNLYKPNYAIVATPDTTATADTLREDGIHMSGMLMDVIFLIQFILMHLKLQ